MFERSPERKIKEWILAMQIEKRLTKPEIFTLYANQINLGHGAYGVEAASRLYFDKPAKELTLEEAAMIAAIIQAPGRLSPFVNPKATLTRRNYVLQRMAEEGYISADEAHDAQQRPLVLQGQQRPEPSIAPYFVEEIRKSLEQQYGADALYQSGLQRADDARRRTAGGGQSRGRSRTAAARQASRRLPEAGAKHRRRDNAR